ncbi:hypothetical protein [Pseudoalteromonas translucida]|uniref:Orphan protein n=1 Tax=Pseudoalteromonas translucida (strain TAC 125) TaxID=326442 RepID=Q3IGK2_PSET1|nr:hypothetical protein [Pseudoalteromonas translucida]CAI86607.1 putative orphan protein [Pseudoalteromonas translucida]
MSTLVWTKQKPTLPGFYFFRMHDTAYSVQHPHVRYLAFDDGELCVIDPEFHLVDELSDDFEYAGPITEPVEQNEISDFLTCDSALFERQLLDNVTTDEQVTSI